MAAVAYVALFDYAATPPEEADEDDEDEISFKAGQTILVTDAEDPEWYRGYVEGASEGESGVFPATYVRPSKSKERRSAATSRQHSEEGVPPASASRSEPDYASLLDSYDGTTARRGSQGGTDASDEKSEIDVYFEVETDDGHDEVLVSVRRTETMQAVAERVAPAVGRSLGDVCELLELVAGSERQTVAEASPSLSLPWRQALTDEDYRFVVPRATPSTRREPRRPEQQPEAARTASHDSLEQLLVTEVSQLEEQRARLSTQLRHAETELAASSLRCTELQTECMGFQSEFVALSREHDQLSVDRSRLTEQCQQQAERLQQMTTEHDAMRATVILAQATTATELSVSKVMEQLEDELHRLQCALGDPVGERQQEDEERQQQQKVHAVIGDASARILDLAAASTTVASLEERLNALQSEYDTLQSACKRNEEEHTREIERLESEHATAMSAQREEFVAVIERLSAEHTRVVKHLQEDAAYATAIAAGGGNGSEDESAEPTRQHREALRLLQAGHDVEMARLREEHAGQLARHTQELEAVSFLVEVPLVKPLAANELRDVAAMMASEYYEDENIVEQGEEGDSMYVIQSGTAVVEKDGRPVATYGPRDFFGERVLVMSGSDGAATGEGGGPGARAATVRADGPVQCFRLGKGPAEELMSRYEHVKEAFEARIQQYEEADYASSSDRASSVGPHGAHDASSGGSSSSTTRDAVTTQRMEPTVVSTTMMAILVDAVRTVSRVTARALQLSDVERSYRALQGEFENISAAYKFKQQEQADVQSQLAAMAAAEAEALAAKCASAEALKTVVGGYQTSIEANNAELRSARLAHQNLQTQYNELSTELRSSERKLAEAHATTQRLMTEQSQDAAAAAAAGAHSAEALELAQARATEMQGKYAHTQQRLESMEEQFRQMEQSEAATARAMRVLRQLTTRFDAGQVFEQLDTNGDGRVTKAELRDGCHRLGLLPLLYSSKETVGGIELVTAVDEQTRSVLSEADEIAVRMTVDAIMRVVDADGDGAADTSDFRRLGEMKEELKRISDQMATVQQESDAKLTLIAQELEQRLADSNVQVATAIAERDDALARIVALEDQLSSSVKERTTLEESLASSRGQLAEMYKAVETQHCGVARLQEQLKQAEHNEKHIKTLLDASVDAAEQQRARFGIEIADLRQTLAKVTEEAQLSEVALTAAMDVVEHCRTKVSAADWLAITSTDSTGA